MTFDEMWDLLKLQTDDLRGIRFTQSHACLLFNSAFKKIYDTLIKYGVYLTSKSTDIDFTSGTQLSALPSDYYHPLWAKFEHSDPDYTIVNVPILSEEASRNGTDPSVFIRSTIVNSTRTTYLGWYVLPGSNFTINFEYVQRVSQFDVDDANIGNLIIAEVPEDFHHIVVNYATVLALSSDINQRSNWWEIYQDSLNDIMGRFGGNARDNAVVDVYDA